MTVSGVEMNPLPAGEHGLRNHAHGLAEFGIDGFRSAFFNLEAPELYEHALRRGEARVAAGGALSVTTGQHTGRSAQDKFVVRDALTADSVWWDNNKPMDQRRFDTLLADMQEHARGRDLYVQDLKGGADASHAINARVVTELAWHSLFIRNLLIRPGREELASFVPDMTILDLPSFRAHPERHGCRTETVIACDFTRRIVLIAGTSYAGEMKKSVFTFLN
ncbi:MAG: phosphoenolpyruvate carboxykinase (ATP), partial [Nitratireductor sp.]|nr:phosphoenolpyruvate carboxykinase (ATP) [Nitratireductor sp.]